MRRVGYEVKNVFIAMITTLICLVPVQVFAAAVEHGDEAAKSEPSGLIVTALTILSIVTMVYLVYLEIRDNG